MQPTTSAASSPSPLSFYHNNRNGGDTSHKNHGGVVLPNLSTSGGNPANSTAPQGAGSNFSVPQQHIMQVSLTQLRTTVPEQRNSMHLS